MRFKITSSALDILASLKRRSWILPFFTGILTATWLAGTCYAANSEVLAPAHSAGAPQKDQGVSVPYRLDSGDHLQMHFYDRFDRDDLNNEYIVDEAGQVTLPRFGQFDVRGKKVAELEQEIRQGIEKTGEKAGPFSIEISQYRPFYVSGLANRPGSYPYLPGITVIHAVSLAGGLYRSPMTTVPDALRERRELTDTLSRLGAHLATRARLVAELEDADMVSTPKELLQLEPIRAGDMIKNEIAIMKRNRAAENRDRTWLEDTISLSKKEADDYRAELTRVSGRIDEQTAISDGLKKLQEQKIINQQRVFEAVVALDSIQRDKEMATTGLSRSTQTLQKAEHDLEMLPLSRKARLSREMAQTEHDIARTKTLAVETRRLATGLEALASHGGAQDIASYRIMRRDESGQWSFITASETTPIMPGDVIQIDSVQKDPGSLF